jgi:TusA-related sulfurtransferase
MDYGKGAAKAAPFSYGRRRDLPNPPFLDSLITQAHIDFMKIHMMNDHKGVPDMPVSELDLRGVICPYNFVKTKLKLETLKQGQVLSVLLDDGDPIRNVPRSVENEGHTVLSQERVDQAYRVLIRREDND